MPWYARDKRPTSVGAAVKSKATTTTTPWYKRGKTLIIGAGALAAAALGVLNLWDRIFPPADDDVARIESINIIKRTPLTGFAPEGIGKLLPLAPVAGTNPAQGLLGPIAAAPHPSGVRPLTTFLPTPTPKPTPTPMPTPTTPSPTPTFTPTGTDSPSPTPSTTSASPTPSSDPAMTILQIPTPLSDEYVDEVVTDDAMKDYVPRAREYTARSLVIEAVDEEGTPVPPAELAGKLAEALEEVEATSGPDGEDPQGWTVAVRVDLQGLAGVPLLLTWSMDGLDVPHTWQAEILAYRVVGATPHDAGVAEIWVPDLKRPGTYNVNIKLSYESTGLIADLRPLPLPDRGVIQGGN